MIDLESRALFDSAYRNLPPAVSDLVFTNLYSWQDIYPYRLSALGKLLLVHYRCGDELIFLPPLLLEGKISEKSFADSFSFAAECLAGFCRKEGLKAVFRFFPELYLKHINTGMFNVEPERDTYDYVYKRENLAGLPGQKYSAKRNLIKQFGGKYESKFELLADHNRHLLYGLLERDESKFDLKVVDRMLKNLEALSLSGGLITSGGKAVAGTIGTVVNNFLYKKGCYDIAVVHFEKALLEYKGAFQAINNYFSSSLNEKVEYINREEDLGLEGLRRAKLSYNPDKLIEKSKLTLK